jgi:hypothetical protein
MLVPAHSLLITPSETVKGLVKFHGSRGFPAASKDQVRCIVRGFGERINTKCWLKWTAPVVYWSQYLATGPGSIPGTTRFSER